MTLAVRDHALSLSATELPAYVYDLTELRGHAAMVRAALPERVELYYAAKANPEPEILAALSPYVDGYEVSSAVNSPMWPTRCRPGRWRSAGPARHRTRCWPR